MRRIVVRTTVVAALAVPTVAQAHVTLVNPMNRYEDMAYMNAYQKSWPCGHTDNPAGALAPVVYQGGDTVSITIDEYVAHSGYIRIAIASSDQDFSNPMSLDDMEGPNTVLLTPDTNPAGEFDVEVTLPDGPCDPCVLQMMQIMTNGSGEFNDNYYQCADIVIEESVDSGSETTGEATTGDETTGDPDPSTTSTTTATTDDSGGATTSTTTGGNGSTTADPTTETGTGGGDPVPSVSSESSGGCSIHSHDGSAGWAALGLLGLIGFRRRG